jgi:hypothetical protein
MRHVIFDIDGTLSDCSHRIHLAKAKEWDKFSELCIEDPVISPVADLLVSLQENSIIVLLTGRNEKFRFQTEEWLAKAGLAPFIDSILMRPDNDWRQDHEMKLALIEEYFFGKENALKDIWFVVEDRDSVVEAFRNYGLTVFQPATGS